MDTADRQNIEDGFMAIAAQASGASMAMLGLICELANMGVLNRDAIARIENFTITSIHQGDATVEAAQALEAIWRNRFAEARRMARP